MKALRYIAIMFIASFVCSCQSFDENFEPTTHPSASQVVTRLADGRLQVRGTMKASSMTQISTRATVANEDKITEGWCLVFGRTQEDKDNGITTYSDGSPLIQVERVTINANYEFVITLSEYTDVAFMRIVANLTAREKEKLASVKTWRKACTDADDKLDEEKFNNPPTVAEAAALTKFQDYRDQSVGLDGIYDMTYKAPNTTQPDPASPRTTGFPMASFGLVLDGGITEESLKAHFGNVVYMIRACSKVSVKVEDANFTMSEVYLLGAAQEARLRSTVLSNQSEAPDGTITVSPTFDIPTDLGGAIDYLPLAVSGKTSDPIYFYPNKGGDAPSSQNPDDNKDINPQYIIIYGRSNLYDTPGYYKVALKAQYPLASDSHNYDKTNTEKWSALTYDILRNTSFTVRLLNVDKPGYKTYEDAASITSPANNISYSIVIESEDSRNEVLVSKGTYYAELETSRVYVKGYMADGVGYAKDGDIADDCYVDFKMIPSPDQVTPAVYVQSSGYDDAGKNNYGSDDVVVTGVKVLRSTDAGYDSKAWNSVSGITQTVNDNNGNLDSNWFKVDPSDADESTRVRVYFKAKGSGRLRLRIGDMLKFIPVVYDPAPISIYGTKGQDGKGKGIVVNGDNGVKWSDFSYASADDITYFYDHVDGANQDLDFKISADGSVGHENIGEFYRKPELRAHIRPSNPGDGAAVLYLRQASDFKLQDGSNKDFIEGDKSNYYVSFTSQGNVYENETGGLFSGAKKDTEVVFDASKESSLNKVSVDGLTIEIDTKTVVGGGTSGKDNFFVSDLNDTKDKLTLDIEAMDYSNQTYESKPDNMITKDYVATSTITVKNSAGDSKTYIVKQTQFAPIYLVAPEGDVKRFMMEGSPSNKTNDEVCVYLINIYGNPSTVDEWKHKSVWSHSSGGDNTDFTYFKTVMYEAMLSNDYLGRYNSNREEYTQKGGLFTKDYTYDRWVDGDKYTVSRMSETKMSQWTTLCELNDRGVLYDSDLCYALIRNTDDMYSGWSKYDEIVVKLTITVNYKDEDYTAVKTFTVF